ncbi:hypothetical protein [Belnapia rosea]|uniref:hypothetical protein n=1 Tax=Belnapia rosea TaxID=938405 RepID=UPI00087FA19C|nr:hypothetical protein [Belnapia rosea]SDB20544.1 hypothetical protein SAMN02927895_00809 [Belnapia rosea]
MSDVFEIAVLCLVGVGVIVAGAGWFIHNSISTQMDHFSAHVERQLKGFGKRLTELEGSLRPPPSDRREREPTSRRAIADGPTATNRQYASDLGVPSGHSTLREESPDRGSQSPDLSQPGGVSTRHERRDEQHSAAAAPAMPAAPADPEAEFLRRAQGAMSSATAFKRFVQQHGGTGYALVPNGLPPSPQARDDSEDKADLWAFTLEEIRVVVPGFNLARNVPLYVADAGRPAEAHLGWLFEIASGEKLQVKEPAVVAISEWKVIRKGHLDLPL